MLYGPRPRALGAPHWHFCRRSGLRFGSKLGPEPGTPPTGPRVARTAGPKKAFFRFCLNRIFEFRKTKNSQHLGAFFRGTIFFTPPPGFRGSSGAENQPHPPEFQKSLYRLEKYTLPVDPSLPMAGLGTDDQKSAAHATTPIATAFKTCVSHRKMGS